MAGDSSLDKTKEGETSMTISAPPDVVSTPTSTSTSTTGQDDVKAKVAADGEALLVNGVADVSNGNGGAEQDESAGEESSDGITAEPLPEEEAAEEWWDLKMIWCGRTYEMRVGANDM
jgi:hypothetical protein